MRVLLTRVVSAEVTTQKERLGQIRHGVLLLVGFTHSDTKEHTAKMAEKVMNLRIMEDAQGKMNHTLAEKGGQVLAVPQFTLYADTSGRRPGFMDAAKPDIAEPLFDTFVEQMKALNLEVQTGEFGAYMIVDSKNDGPLTLILEN
jgi:D-aminoacyl-tRNA deacylase